MQPRPCPLQVTWLGQALCFQTMPGGCPGWNPKVSHCPGFPIVPGAGCLSRDSTAGRAQTKDPRWHSRPGGLCLTSQWHPGNEWWLQQRKTAWPWQRNHKERAPRAGTCQAGKGRRDIFNPLGGGAEAGFGVSLALAALVRTSARIRPPKQNTRLKNIGCRDAGPGL